MLVPKRNPRFMASWMPPCLSRPRSLRIRGLLIGCVLDDAVREIVSSGDSFSENELFVSWFRQAWPYIRGHRGSVFVVVISGEIVDSPHLDSILQRFAAPAAPAVSGLYRPLNVIAPAGKQQPGSQTHPV
ncbi:Amino-acid N-acetyltransferase protein [Dioscorea alata]|uniref:Amino-acid N-acetyltransferase protein n=1 Tax=Dioscorea alata TaxID=55571 RepID=A0ACB7URN6_DIOAL|nr:Amino-acid N-acetyltransferase protein [Dioscorea alata]